MTVEPHIDPDHRAEYERDIAQVLRDFLQAYPEDIFPTPPPERQAKDAAAAHIMRVLAYPTMSEALAEIERLRDMNVEILGALAGLVNAWTSPKPDPTARPTAEAVLAMYYPARSDGDER